MKEFTLDGIEFVQEIGGPQSRGTSSGDRFVIVKTDQMLAFYRGLAETRPRTVMEIGMFEGGSLVWYDKIFSPTRLVGLDLRSEPIAALEKYRAGRPHIATYYGRYQDQPETLAAARENFPDGIDLVVDDASHMYEQSKATFRMLFPLVTPGGHYVIEDWGWAHRPATQKADHPWARKSALTSLVFELVVLCSQSPAVESIHVDRGLVSVKRGKGLLPNDLFDFSDCLRGTRLQTL